MVKKKSKRKNGKNGSARKAAEGFEVPGFFGGLDFDMEGGLNVGQQLLGGDQGTFQDSLEIPELGEGFNERFGQVGGGFIEEVSTFDVGASPGGGDLRSGGSSKLERAARREGKQGGRASRPKPPASATTKSPVEIAAGGVGKGFKSLRERFKRRSSDSQFSKADLETEKRVDAVSRERIQEKLEEEKQRTGIRGMEDPEGKGALR